jgi:hypothetical protein
MAPVDGRGWEMAARAQTRRIFGAWIQGKAAQEWVVPEIGLWPWGSPTPSVTQAPSGWLYSLPAPGAEGGGGR